MADYSKYDYIRILTQTKYQFEQDCFKSMYEHVNADHRYLIARVLTLPRCVYYTLLYSTQLYSSLLYSTLLFSTLLYYRESCLPRCPLERRRRPGGPPRRRRPRGLLFWLFFLLFLCLYVFVDCLFVIMYVYVMSLPFMLSCMSLCNVFLYMRCLVYISCLAAAEPLPGGGAAGAEAEAV